MTSARFPPIPPSALSEEQKPAHDEADKFARHMGPFTQKDPNTGALIGPFSVLLYTPTLVAPSLKLVAQISSYRSLNPQRRELAILATGHVYGSPYELYAHTRIAINLPKPDNLSAAQIAQARKGQSPAGLDEKGQVAYEFALELAGSRGPLRDEGKGGWARAKGTLDIEEVAALVHVVGAYAYLCIMLNAADVGLPEGEEIDVPKDKVDG